MSGINRREWISGMLCAGQAWAARPKGELIESHVHLYSDDPARFPLANAGPGPQAYTVETFLAFAKEAAIDHAVIVSPEPYQDDHRYLEYCLERAPSKGFFKSSCLFDPIDKRTPQRLAELVKRNPAVAALRIHEMHEKGTPSTTTGAIRNRDLRDPRMAETWSAAADLGLMIQVHLIPHHAVQLGELAAKFRNMPVLLDHLARAGHDTPEDFDQVLKLAELPKVYIKYSGTGVTASSKQPYPHPDAKAIVKRTFDAFGPDRMVWGELGNNMTNFEKAIQLFDLMFDFASEADRARIRGLTAKKLFAFS